MLRAPILLVALFATAGPALAQSPLDALAEKYKVHIVTKDLRLPLKTEHGEIDGRLADDKALAAYAEVFAAEFAIYPPGLIQRTRLKRVVLCEEVSFTGQRRTAIPDFPRDTLYYDVSRGFKNRTYTRKVIHHEFYHLIDLRDDGQLYKDERWLALNVGGVKYGQGGKLAQDLPDTSTLTTKYPGFLNHYSTTGVEEDKAETFAALIVEPEYIAGRMKDDAMIRAKVELLQGRLAQFCPQANAKFWATAQAKR